MTAPFIRLMRRGVIRRRRSAAALTAPVCVTPPALLGTPTQGYGVGYTPGVWVGATTVTPVLRRNGVAIEANPATYVYQPADVGAVFDLVETGINARGPQSQASAPVGPIAALAITVGPMAFDDAGGTKLSAMGWDLASPGGNGDGYEANGAGQLRKIVTSGVCLYLGIGENARTQRVSADILQSTNALVGVMCAWDGGLDGYVLRRTDASTCRLLRYTAGSPTNLIGALGCGTGVLGIRCVVSPDDGTVHLQVTENGVDLSGGNHDDTSGSRKTRGRVAVVSLATPALNPSLDTLTAYATDYFLNPGTVPDPDPGDPDPGDPGDPEGLTFDGVTFSLAGAEVTGEYVLGRPWVLNTDGVTLLATDPPCQIQASGAESPGSPTFTNRTMHGLEINPGAASHMGGIANNQYGDVQGFDSYTAGKDPNANAGYSALRNRDPAVAGPQYFAPGQTATLVKAISAIAPAKQARPALQRKVPLSIVCVQPSAGQFDPPPALADKDDPDWVFNRSEVDLSILKSLPKPTGWPTFDQVMAMVLRMYHTGVTDNLKSRNLNPFDNMPGLVGYYGQGIAQNASTVFLSLNFDFTTEQKALLADGVCSIAIHIAGRLAAGGRWRGFGAGNIWAKQFLVMGAALLHQAANIERLTQFCDATQHPDRLGEDTQLLTVGRPLVDNTRTINSTGDPHISFPPFAVGEVDWTNDDENWTDPNARWNTDYRGITAAAISGAILGLRLTDGAIALWNNPRLVAYYSRFWDHEKVRNIPNTNDGPSPWSCFRSPRSDPNPSGTANDYLAHLRAAMEMYWDQGEETPAWVEVRGEGKYVWLTADAMLTVRQPPAADAFALGGHAAGIVATGVWGHKAWAEIDPPLPPGAAFTLGIAEAAVASLGGIAAPALAPTAGVNQTGALPAPAPAIEPVASNGVSRMRCPIWMTQREGVRRAAVFNLFRPPAAPVAGQNISAAGSGSKYRHYFPSPDAYRLSFGGQSLRPIGIPVTNTWQIHGAVFDLTRGSQSSDGLSAGDVGKYLVNGAKAAQSASTLDTTMALAWNLDQDVFFQGLGIFDNGNGTNGAGRLDGAFAAWVLYIDDGSGDFPDVEAPGVQANLAAIAAAANGDDWEEVLERIGGNGEGLVGGLVPFLAFFGSRAEANAPDPPTVQEFAIGGWPNRGSGPARQLMRRGAALT
ncbi:MAG: hypothetical protein U1C74_14765 [Phenylobacterium sp.]|nr:hypothetical protein [Phenylobacterium sp.]